MTKVLQLCTSWHTLLLSYLHLLAKRSPYNAFQTCSNLLLEIAMDFVLICTILFLGYGALHENGTLCKRLLLTQLALFIQ